MSTNGFTYNDIFDNSNVFFEKNGSSVMVLTSNAAIEVCQEATARNLWILGVDGGHWQNPGFKIDGNTSWSRKTKLFNENKLSENNQLAIENIVSDTADGYTAFLVTISD
ncbi:colicin transporter [Morganella morganii]